MQTNFGELNLIEVNGTLRVAGKGQARAVTPETAPKGLEAPGNLAPKYDSKLEAAFHQQLLARKKLGEFEVVLFHAIALTLAEQTRYTPDFLCRTPQGEIVIFETKGYMREAARVRLNVAAELFWWWRFVLVTKQKGQWIERTIRDTENFLPK